MFDKLEIRNKTVYIAFFFIALGTAFSSTYNPFNFVRMHVDSSVYITVARGITRGYLPYKDFVDNKGPFAYFLSVPGLLTGGFTGVWLTEIVLLFVTALFAWKTALFFTTRNKALFATAFCFIALLPFLFVNAGTEEYSLPFLTISFYIFTKYYFSLKKDVGFCELIVLGICFAVAVMIRLNMFPLWAGFCTIIFLESVIKRRFALLGKYVSGFCLGIIIIFIPVFLYLKLNGIMEDFFIQVILNGVSRGFNAASAKEIWKNFFIVLDRKYSFFPLLLGLFWLMTKYTRNRSGFYFGYILSYLLMVLFFSFLNEGGIHYNSALFPFFIPALVFLVDVIYEAFLRVASGGKFRKKTPLVFLTVFFCFVFSEEIINYLWDLSKVFHIIPKETTGLKLVNAGKMIDENTKPGDKIISLGYDAYIYSFTRRAPASKYFYQSASLDSIPGAREEFLSDVLNGKPAVIALFSEVGGKYFIIDDWHGPVMEMVEKEYRLLSDENGFILYIRK